MTIFNDNFNDSFGQLLTILDNFDNFDNFDNWKDSPGDLTFETLITILTIENLNSDNHSYLTINCDTGQHSQFLRCFTDVDSEESTAMMLIDQSKTCCNKCVHSGKKLSSLDGNIFQTLQRESCDNRL